MSYYNGFLMTEEKAEERHKIYCKAKLHLPLTAQERTIYLLFIASTEEMHEFLKREQLKNV